MAGHYNPKHFLRQVPQVLLQEFFERRGELLDLSWDELDSKDVESIYEAWYALPEPQRADGERWFRAVWALAGKEGLRTVIEEGAYRGIDLKEPLEQFEGLLEKIFWVYLNHERVILSANRLDHADHLNARYWRRRNDLPAKKPDVSRENRQVLGRAISEYYRENQGRGEFCSVEAFLRREVIHYLFVYPSDYADTALVYNNKGVLDRQPQKSAFDVIFAYNEQTGSLDVFVQGDKNLRRDMEAIFCRVVLNEDLPELPPKRPYDLAPLRNRHFEFPTSPEDNILQTRVRSLRLSVASPGCGRITFEGHEGRRRGSVYDLMERYMDRERLDSSVVYVTRVGFEVTFRLDDGNKKVQFNITHPDSCTLREDPEHLILKEYLLRWGIATEAESERVLAAGG